ncbi:MAG: CPBP family intramembrane metalloprotease [Tepidisphaera sp.]|nr:CPBP family intramembrane metalloprotease [Tepidisphaera sp.]
MAKRAPIPNTYAAWSSRPLHVLAFLAPLLVLYEIGSVVFLSGPALGAETIGARGILGSFFHAFGVASLHLPPVALVAVLLTWHLMLRDPWKLKTGVLAGMAAESLLWAVPLLVLGVALSMRSQPAAPSPALIGQNAALAELSWQARLTVSIGAGIYEELLFRLILIGLVHFVVVDLMKFHSNAGYVVGAMLSAVLFALSHDLAAPGGGVDLRLLAFYVAAGLYFATVFIWRGFGVVVAAHAMYDAIALLVFLKGG